MHRVLPPLTPGRAETRSAAKDWLRALQMTGRLDAEPSRTLPAAIDELALRLGETPALLSDAEIISYRDLSERSRRYARWALAEGLGKGDVVALLMPNRPEYVAIWLGLSRVGVTCALVNPELKGASLAHALGVAKPRAVILDASLAAVFLKARAGLESKPRLWAHGDAGADLPRVDLAIGAYPEESLALEDAPPVTLADRALLIYTSGTTGLPKAANVSHHRVMSWASWFCGLIDITPTDRLYDCLPLCHSAGGVAAVGAALIGGASVVIAPKFSASRFWDDLARWDCTLFQYIGELCRYLLAAPPHPKERAHSLRLCSGNGLSREVWDAFQGRFQIPRILEFYASTEGTFSLYNVEGRAGAIGRTPGYLAHRFPAAIVRFDPDLGEPTRGPDGLCIACAPGEAGEAIGRVSVAGAARFEGYTDGEASERKLIRNVFAPGDLWARTGDLMRKDAEGFYWFVDRIGETFRWKGENVSTAEVGAALCAYPGVIDACVYGVETPGASGKAGMATIVAGETFDLAGLPAHLAARLADFARPVFLRFAPALELTQTFKRKARTLAQQGWNPAGAEVFVFDRAAGAYVKLGAALAERIRAGEFRL
jgi:fatty-acyl-CoA synthase